MINMENFEFTYKCENCAECCKNWNVARFDPSMADKNGVCIYLDTETNLCKIYDSRPDFCNICTLYNKYYSHIDLDYYLQDLRVGCDALIKIGQRQKKRNEKK